MQASARSKLCASLCIGSKGEPAATVLANPSIGGGSSCNSSPYVQPQCPYSPILVQGVLGKTAPVVPAVRSARVGASHAAMSLLNHSTSAPSAYPPTAPAPRPAALCRRSRAAARASASTSCLCKGRWVSPATLRASRRAYLVKPLHKSPRRHTPPFSTWTLPSSQCFTYMGSTPPMQKCREPQSTAKLGGPSECWADRNWPSANAGAAHAEGARTTHENAQISAALARPRLSSLLAARFLALPQRKHVTRNHLSTSQTAVAALVLPRCRTQGKELQAHTHGAAASADSLTRHLKKRPCRRAQPQIQASPDTLSRAWAYTERSDSRARGLTGVAQSAPGCSAARVAAQAGPNAGRLVGQGAHARAPPDGGAAAGRSQGQAHAVPHVAQHRLRRAEQLQQLLVGARLRRRQLPRLHLRAAACRVSAGPPRGRAGARRGPAGSTRAPAGCAPGRGSMPYQACATC